MWCRRRRFRLFLRQMREFGIFLQCALAIVRQKVFRGRGKSLLTIGLGLEFGRAFQHDRTDNGIRRR